MSQRVLDVSALPIGTDDSRALIWWGNIGMMVIEGTVFAMALTTFLYLRMANLDWPPATVPKPDMLWPTINLVLLILSAIPAVMADRAAQSQDVFGMRFGMLLCVRRESTPACWYRRARRAPGRGIPCPSD